MRTRFYAVALIAFCGCSGILALDGKAAVVVSDFLAPVDGPQDANASRLMVVGTKSTGNVTSIVSSDTILRGRFYYPMWSFDGTRIAFYKDGAGLCVVNADGSNLRTLVTMPDWGGEDKFYNMSWPGADDGKYIYYVMTCNNGCYRNSSGEIWKVNVDNPSENSMICDYTRSNDLISPGIPWFGRFQLSCDAKYAAIHAGGAPSEAVWGFQNGCIPHEFPPVGSPNNPDPNLTEPSCTGQYNCDYPGDCNTGLSASGTIFYHFSGGHVCVYANYWDHAAGTITGRHDIGTGPWGSVDMTSDIQPWLSTGPGLGGCLVWPKGSSNSDRVLTVITGWKYGDMYSPAGGNLVIVDWKDKKAAIVTNNPIPTFASWGGVEDGTRYWVTEPGDFWVSGGPEGCYEAIDGSWVNVASGQTVDAVRRPAVCGMQSQSVGGPTEVYNLRGERVGVYRTHARLGSGTYIVSGTGVAPRVMVSGNGLTPSR